MNMITKKQLAAALTNPTQVTFFKANGDTRRMLAQTNPDGEPAQYANSDALSVVDTKTGNYKAIKASSVISINNEVV